MAVVAAGDVVLHLAHVEWGPVRVRAVEKDAYLLESLDGTVRRVGLAFAHHLAPVEPGGLGVLVWRHPGESLLDTVPPDEVVIALLRDAGEPVHPRDLERRLVALGLQPARVRAWGRAPATQRALAESRWLDRDAGSRYHLRAAPHPRRDALDPFRKEPYRRRREPTPEDRKAGREPDELGDEWNPAKLERALALAWDEPSPEPAPAAELAAYFRQVAADPEVPDGTRLRALTALGRLADPSAELRALLETADWDTFDARDLGEAREAVALIERVRVMGEEPDAVALLQRLAGAPQSTGRGRCAGDAAYALLLQGDVPGDAGEALLAALPSRFEWALARLLGDPPPTRFAPAAPGAALGAALERAPSRREVRKRLDALAAALPQLAERYPASIPALARELLRSEELSPDLIVELFLSLRAHPEATAAVTALLEAEAASRPWVLRAWRARLKADTVSS